jgi:hypothetical protein
MSARAQRPRAIQLLGGLARPEGIEPPASWFEAFSARFQDDSERIRINALGS